MASGCFGVLYLLVLFGMSTLCAETPAGYGARLGIQLEKEQSQEFRTNLSSSFELFLLFFSLSAALDRSHEYSLVLAYR